MAFSLENYKSAEMKHDEKYIKTFARMVGKKNGKVFSQEIKTHRCTEADYAKFLPVSASSAFLLNELKTNERRGLWCLDQAEIKLFGNEQDLNESRLEISVLPCNHRLTHIGGAEDRIPDDCVADLNE